MTVNTMSITLSNEHTKEIYTAYRNAQIAENMRKQIGIALANKEKEGWKPFEKSQWRIKLISESDTVEYQRAAIVLSEFFNKFYTPDIAENALMQRIIVGFVNNENFYEIDTIDMDKTFE